MESTDNDDLRALVAEIVSSYLRKNPVAATDLSDLITTIHRSLHGLGKAPEPAPVLLPAFRYGDRCITTMWSA